MTRSAKSRSKISGFSLLLMTSLLITQAQTTGTGNGLPPSQPTGEVCIPMNFEATAYYSPLSNQRFFWNGSYDAEIKMNGNGIAGASGKPVFNGMVAAPSQLAFGTQIVIPGRGMGSVEDRGGMINQVGLKTRIDIRMGKGEEGLLRTMSFGRRNLSGMICSGMQAPQLGFNFDNVSIAPDFFWKTLRMQNLSVGRSDPWVHILQKHLQTTQHLQAPFSQGTFDENTKQAVCALQLEYGIVGDSEDPLCGVFGQQTRTQLQKTLKEKSSQLTTKTTTPIKAVEPVKIAPTLQQKKGGTVVRISRAYLVGESHPEIGQLQKFLKEQKMYAGEITNIYDKATLEAIYLFQLAHTILTDQSPVGIRGYLGPTTQKKLLESSQQ